MKTVHNNSQVCHLWANQSQSNARNSNSTLYFQGKDIYSYGSHFLAARMYTIDGQNYALVNNRRYSPTTGSHLSDIRNALDYNYLNASNPSDPKQSLTSNAVWIMENYYNEFKATKFREYWSDLTTADRFQDQIDKHNQWCKLFKLPKLEIEFTQLHKTLLDEKYLQLKQRDAELNTPEAIAKREENNRKAAERKELKAQKELAEKIPKWRNGENTSRYLHGVVPQILRIKDNEVQTSGGASVPLIDAIALLNDICNGKAIPNVSRVGHFTYNGFTNSEKTIIKIGCHQIALSEAKNILTMKVGQ